jgi:hypothetical protein
LAEVGWIGFVDRHVLEAALEQFAVDLAQFFFVFNRKNDRIGL